MKTEPEDEDSEESSLANHTDINTSSASNANASKSTVDENSPSPLSANAFNAANNDKPFRDRFDSDDDDNFWWAMDESDNEKGAEPLPVKVEIEEGSGSEALKPEVPVKRKRGRPKGSKTVNRRVDKEKNAKGKFTCTTCGKDLKFKSHLVRHSKMHQDEKKRKRKKKKKNKQRSPYTVSSSEDDVTDCDKDSFFDCVSEDEAMRLEQVKEEPLDDDGEDRGDGDQDMNESQENEGGEDPDGADKPLVEGEVKVKKKRGRKKKSEKEGEEWGEVGPDGEVRKKRERKRPKEPCICGVCGKDLR